MAARLPLPAVEGRRFGHYRILEKIGQGGMGEVWRARHTTLSRKFALKFLDPKLALEPNAVLRFRREAQAVNVIQHPNIVEIFDFGEAKGSPYLVMEYLDGCSLAALLKKNGFLSFSRIIRESLGRKAARQTGRGTTSRSFTPAWDN